VTMKTSRVCNLDAVYHRKGRGPITLKINGRLAERIRDMAESSRASSAANWCLEALEFMLDEHRSGKYRPTSSEQYHERNGNEADV